MLINAQFQIRFCLWATCFGAPLAHLEEPILHTLRSLHFLKAQISTFLLKARVCSKLGGSLRHEQLWKIISITPRCFVLTHHSSFGFPEDFLSGDQGFRDSFDWNLWIICIWHSPCCCVTWLPGQIVFAFPVPQQLSQAGDFDLFLILQLY